MNLIEFNKKAEKSVNALRLTQDLETSGYRYVSCLATDLMKPKIDRLLTKLGVFSKIAEIEMVVSDFNVEFTLNEKNEMKIQFNGVEKDFVVKDTKYYMEKHFGLRRTMRFFPVLEVYFGVDPLRTLLIVYDNLVQHFLSEKVA